MTDHQPVLIPPQPIEGGELDYLPLALFTAQVAGQPKPDKSFVDSLADYGQFSPVVVRRQGDTLTLVDGRRRVLALITLADRAGRSLEEATVKAEVFEADRWSHDEVISLIANQQRSPNIVSELESIEALLAAGFSLAAICEATGLRRSTVEMRLRLTGLVPQLREALKAGQMAPGVADRAARLPADLQAQRLVPLLEETGKITGTDVKDARRVEVTTKTADLFDLSDFETPGAEAAAGPSSDLQAQSDLNQLRRFLAEQGLADPEDPARVYWPVRKLTQDRAVLLSAIASLLAGEPGAEARLKSAYAQAGGDR